MKEVFRRLLMSAYFSSGRLINNLVSILFKIFIANSKKGVRVCYPIYLKGAEYISIGTNFSAEPGLRIEAWDEYLNIKHYPQILIGNNVCVGFNVHIGAISRIQIGNNVLIGSNVLISDHQHGESSTENLNLSPINRSLFSKGEVVIGDNVWIGDGVCIMDGVRVGRNSIIGANAVVVKNVLEGEIVGGVPAKALKRLI